MYVKYPVCIHWIWTNNKIVKSESVTQNAKEIMTEIITRLCKFIANSEQSYSVKIFGRV